MVFFHFVPRRHAVEFGFVTACVAVFAGFFELPFAVLYAYVAVFAGTFKLTLAAVFVSGYGLFASTVCSQVSFPFSWCSFTEILAWSIETSPAPNEAEGLHPAWVFRGSWWFLGEWCERRFGAHQVFFDVPVVSVVR